MFFLHVIINFDLWYDGGGVEPSLSTSSVDHVPFEADSPVSGIRHPLSCLTPSSPQTVLLVDEWPKGYSRGHADV
jgi:hypothetical protein